MAEDDFAEFAEEPALPADLSFLPPVTTHMPNGTDYTISHENNTEELRNTEEPEAAVISTGPNLSLGVSKTSLISMNDIAFDDEDFGDFATSPPLPQNPANISEIKENGSTSIDQPATEEDEFGDFKEASASAGSVSQPQAQSEMPAEDEEDWGEFAEADSSAQQPSAPPPATTPAPVSILTPITEVPALDTSKPPEELLVYLHSLLAQIFPSTTFPSGTSNIPPLTRITRESTDTSYKRLRGQIGDIEKRLAGNRTRFFPALYERFLSSLHRLGVPKPEAVDRRDAMERLREEIRKKKYALPKEMTEAQIAEAEKLDELWKLLGSVPRVTKEGAQAMSTQELIAIAETLNRAIVDCSMLLTRAIAERERLKEQRGVWVGRVREWFDAGIVPSPNDPKCARDAALIVAAHNQAELEEAEEPDDAEKIPDNDERQAAEIPGKLSPSGTLRQLWGKVTAAAPNISVPHSVTMVTSSVTTATSSMASSVSSMRSALSSRLPSLPSMPSAANVTGKWSAFWSRTKPPPVANTAVSVSSVDSEEVVVFVRGRSVPSTVPLPSVSSITPAQSEAATQVQEVTEEHGGFCKEECGESDDTNTTNEAEEAEWAMFSRSPMHQHSR